VVAHLPILYSWDVIEINVIGFKFKFYYDFAQISGTSVIPEYILSHSLFSGKLLF
jgi:hypothetical protein